MRIRSLSGLAIMLAALCGGWLLIADSSPPSRPSDESINLLIRVWPDGPSREVLQTRIACPQPGRESRACTKLRRMGIDALQHRPDPDQMCTAETLGPAQATVQGIWTDQGVDIKLSLHNGCEIARWRKLQPALPLPRV